MVRGKRVSSNRKTNCKRTKKHTGASKLDEMIADLNEKAEPKKKESKLKKAAKIGLGLLGAAAGAGLGYYGYKNWDTLKSGDKEKISELLNQDKEKMKTLFNENKEKFGKWYDESLKPNVSEYLTKARDFVDPYIDKTLDMYDDTKRYAMNKYNSWRNDYGDDINNKLDNIQSYLLNNPSSVNKEMIIDILDQIEQNVKDEDPLKVNDIKQTTDAIRKDLRIFNDYIKNYENGDTYGKQKINELNNNLYSLRYKYNGIMQ